MIEKIGIEHVPIESRHGKPIQLFTLWLASNLTIADYALGFLPISLGVPLSSMLVALLAGNILGSLFLAGSVAMGPRMGFPQMFISRWSFGRRGNYFFAVLNWVSTVGWFTVNVILGTFAIQTLLPSMPFYLGAVLTVLAEVLFAIFGYDIIHSFEKIMAVVLGVLFAFATALVLGQHSNALLRYSPKSAVGGDLALFAITLAASFSYVMSWSSYGSDYSRYLPENTSYKKLIVNSFLGAFIASFWLEVLGAFVAILAPTASDSISALPAVFGFLGIPIVVAVIFGGVAANVLNVYTNALSALVLDVRIKRWVAVIIGGFVGLLLAFYGASSFWRFYEQFLLLLDYWITPWLGIVMIDFFVLKRMSPLKFRLIPDFSWRGGVSYLIGFLVSVAFIPSIRFVNYSGPIAQFFGGADFSYFISFLVSAALYYLLSKRSTKPLE
jgi:NCS1 family nucleobase:cation symporter-1